MPIEIIPKEKKEVPLWQPILFYLFLVMLLAVIAGYFILGRSQNNYQTELENLKIQLAQFKTPERVELENEVSSWEKKIGNFSPILDEHPFISGVFKLIEDTTHPKVRYIKFDLMTNENTLILSGETDDFLTLGQQVIFIKNNPEIQNVDLVGLSISKDNKINFILKILLNQEIFKQ